MLEVKNLVKVYKTKGGVDTRALDGVSVNFPETGLVFLLGKSGSGKSTLLNMIGGLDRPDSGEIIVKGRSSKDFSQADFDSYRNTYIGFIFQEYNVLNEFNIEQNISLALQLQGKKNDKDAVNALLKEVDLEGFNKRKPNTLSGGQKQRIAIARALIKQPEIIMADEPTGALDSNTGKQVLETLKRLSKTKLVIIVSHDQDFAEEYGDRIIELKDGKIISDKSKEFVAPKALNEKMQIINGNIIDIKKGSALTEADFKQLYQLIKRQDKEVLISTGEENIKVTKKAARISEDGKGERFSDTKEVAVKKYDGKQTKFIRSHMPFSRSFKMGASGLKTKPIRLIFTILLSVVSFTMFGVASTLMFYDASYSLAQAMSTMDRRSEAVAKYYRYKARSVTIDNATGEVIREGDEYDGKDQTYFGVNEIKELNNGTNKYIGIFNFDSYFDYTNKKFEFQTISVSSDASDYYSYNGFTGLSDSAKDIFAANGYNLTGTYPEASNEVAISNYHFDLIKESNALGVLNNYNDILNKTIKVRVPRPNWMSADVDFKVTGVYDFGQLNNAYDSLKQPKPASTSANERSKEVDKLKAYLGSSLYTTGYVSEAFYEKYGYVPTRNNNSVNSYYPQGIIFGENRDDIESRTVMADEGFSTFIYEDFQKVPTEYYNLNLEPVSEAISIKSGEVLLQYSQYASNVEEATYWAPISRLKDMAFKSSNINPEAEELNNQLYNTETTNEFALAHQRLERYFMEKGMDNPYPDGYTLEGDFTSLANELIRLYAKTSQRDYIKQAAEACSNYFYSGHDAEKPLDWNDKISLINNFSDYDNQPTQTQVNNLAEYLHDVIAGNATLRTYIPLYNYLVGFYNGLYYSIQNELAQKAQEQFSKDFYYYTDQLISNPGDASAIQEAEDYLTFAYKFVYGSEASVPAHDEFNSTAFPVPYIGESGVNVPKKVYTKDVSGNIKEYTVRGLINTNSSYNYGPVMVRSDVGSYLKESYSWVTTYTSDYEKPEDTKYAYVIAITDYSQGDIAAFTKDYGTYHYKMTNAVYTEASMWTDMISTLKTVFLIVGAVTGGLAALMMLNFISISISAKKKDIGILRAVGARGSDVFKIFFSESTIIAIVCFLISAIGAGITCYELNNMFKESILGIPLLSYGFINILLILGVAAVVSFIATLIPVTIASKKPPVEAIRAL